MIDFEAKKMLFIDLDGTLIKTISGKTFPEDITDFRIQLSVLNKIVEKLPNLNNRFANSVGSDAQYCPSIDKTDLYRKPNTAMLESLFTQWDVKSKEECIMIGDASGKPGDFSDSDKKCAENFGIDYIDVRDFLEL